MEPYLYHPIVNHFTIALFLISVLFDLLGLITRKESFHRAAWLNLIVAAVGVVATIITGTIAGDTVSHGEAVHEIMERHETLGYIVGGCVIAAFIWRLILKGVFPRKAMIFYLLILLAGSGTMVVNAYWGGQMAFEYGVTSKENNAPGREGHHHHSSQESSHEDEPSTP